VTSFRMKEEITVREALAERDSLREQLGAVRDSFSFRLGNMLVQAVAIPGRNTVLLPYRLARMFRAELRRRGARAGESIKCSDIRLAGVKLSAHTAAIKEKYVEHFGASEGRLGLYRDDDWKRIEYASSLLPPAESVLDVGIGNGAFLNLLVSLDRFRTVLGIDTKRHSKFAMLFESHLYQIMYASVTNLPFANKSIDVVTCMEVLEHLDREAFLAALPELRRVGRSLVMTVPYNEPEPRPSYHKLRFTDGDLLTYFPHGELIRLRKPTGTDWMVIVERS
jgi:SAM-dependent methyltransferase